LKVTKAFREQEQALDEFCDSGSNWTFDRAVAFDIEIAAIRPLVIGSMSESDTDLEGDTNNYHKYRVNLTNIKNKQSLFNPNNKDHKCFLRCVFHLLKIGKMKRDFTGWEGTLDLKTSLFQ